MRTLGRGHDKVPEEKGSEEGGPVRCINQRNSSRLKETGSRAIVEYYPLI